MTYEDQFADGNHEAFDRLVEEYETRLICYFTKHEARDPEASTQEVFVRIFQSPGEFRETNWFVTRLLVIAKHLLIDERRRKSAGEIVDSEVVENAHASETANQVDSQDERDSIRKAVAELPIEERAVIQLRIFKELTQKAAAHELGISLMCLRAREYRAKHQLRKKLGDQDLDPPSR